MLNIRYEPPQKSEPCPCGCGGHTVGLTRLVEKDGEAIAILYALYVTSHADKRAAAVVSLGHFGEGTTPQDRVAFPMQARPQGEGIQLTLTDAAQSPWQDEETLGRTLGREEAAAHPWLDDAYELAGHVLQNDMPLVRYLRGAPATPSTA